MKNIPDQIKICAYTYQVIKENRYEEHGVVSAGTHDAFLTKIWIDNTANKQVQEESLVHEFIEAINKLNDFQLNHQTISTLAENLYQILADNKLDFSI
jgi:hypothetical protein